MDKVKVNSFHKELNKVLDLLAKKHGFAAATVRTLSYNDARISGRMVVVANRKAVEAEDLRSLRALGYEMHDKITVKGFESMGQLEVVGATNRGTLIALQNGKRYRLSPRYTVIKVGAKLEGFTEEIRKEFERIAGELSPENLTCDGEASPQYVALQRKRLAMLWRDLEVRVGRKVSEQEIWDVVIARNSK